MSRFLPIIKKNYENPPPTFNALPLCLTCRNNPQWCCLAPQDDDLSFDISFTIVVDIDIIESDEPEKSEAGSDYNDPYFPPLTKENDAAGQQKQ